MSNVDLVRDNKSGRKKNNSINADTSKDSGKFNRIIMILFFVMTAVYGALCLYLYYNQSVQPAIKDVSAAQFESDLPYHISMVIDDGWYYSFTAFIYVALYYIAGKSTVLIAVFLAAVSAATIIVTEKLLTAFGIKNKGITCGGAFVLNMLMPFYIRWAGMYRYVSYQSGNVWHNSTYQCMKLVALICMLLFIKWDKRVANEGIKLKEWIVFSLALAVCTGIKPSFLTVFAPAFAVKLLINWLKDKVPFKRILVWGLTVIPSCAVILWQNAVLFGAETDNGFKISFMETFSFHADRPKVTVILSLAFPLVIFACYVIDLIRSKKIKSIFEDRAYLFSIMMAIVGFGEAALLIETGTRSRDGNFLWGYSIALAWIYLLSFVKWYRLLEKKRWILFGVSTLVLVYQFYCGVKFFSMLMSGITYFMYY